MGVRKHGWEQRRVWERVAFFLSGKGICGYHPDIFFLEFPYIDYLTTQIKLFL